MRPGRFAKGADCNQDPSRTQVLHVATFCISPWRQPIDHRVRTVSGFIRHELPPDGPQALGGAVGGATGPGALPPDDIPEPYEIDAV